MNKNKYLKQKGFTLIEVLVTMSVFVVVVFGVAAIINDIFVKSSQQLTSMSNIDQARLALNTFTNEIRNAITGKDGSYPLNQAGDTQIIFFSNYKISNGQIARIRYYISGNTLYKGITLPTGSPATYNTSSESVYLVATGISTSSQIFYYYDGNYTGTTSALSQPVNINNVRYIKISLMVLNKITPTDSSTFPIMAGAAIRSIKDNLGN